MYIFLGEDDTFYLVTKILFCNLIKKNIHIYRYIYIYTYINKYCIFIKQQQVARIKINI